MNTFPLHWLQIEHTFVSLCKNSFGTIYLYNVRHKCVPLSGPYMVYFSRKGTHFKKHCFGYHPKVIVLLYFFFFFCISIRDLQIIK